MLQYPASGHLHLRCIFKPAISLETCVATALQFSFDFLVTAVITLYEHYYIYLIFQYKCKYLTKTSIMEFFQ